MARDRTARARIRRYLAQYGPVVDTHGLATKVLKDAVDYEGSSVAFIQLMAAMERDGELEREIRGKRTYGIDLAASATSEALAAESPGDLTPFGQMDIDYEALARALLHELTAVDAPAVLEQMRAENERIARERDEYARRLEMARAKLAELRGSVRGSPR